MVLQENRRRWRLLPQLLLSLAFVVQDIHVRAEEFQEHRHVITREAAQLRGKLHHPANESGTKLVRKTRVNGDSDEERDSDEDIGPGETIFDQESDDDIRLEDESKGIKKCFNLLHSTAEGNKLSRSQYLEFLHLISNGHLDYSTFSELPAALYVLFYATACSSAQECHHEEPFISLYGNRGTSFSNLRFFCQEVLTYTYSVALLSFEFSIRYDANVISTDQAAKCLSAATEDLLLDHFGCATEQAARNLRESAVDSSDTGFDDGSESLVPDDSLMILPPEQSSPSLIRKLGIRQKYSAAGSTSSEDSSSEGSPSVEVAEEYHCPYKIETVVDVLDFACIPPDRVNEGTKCGLAQASVSVVAEQLVQPSEEALYIEVTQTLREAIDSGSLKQYFAPDCQFQT